MGKKIDTKKEIEIALHFLVICMAIFVYGLVFAIAGWGWLLLNFEKPILNVLAGWALLFYLFSMVAYPLLNVFKKYGEK